MANTESAKKQQRSNERRRLRNRTHIGRARSEVKKARAAIAIGDETAATEAVRLAAKWLDHAATKGSIHPNNAARRKGRLMSQLAHMEVRPVSALVEADEAPAKPAKAARGAKPKAEKPAKEAKPAKEEKAAPRSRAKKSDKKE